MLFKLFKISLRLFPGLFAVWAGIMKLAGNQFNGSPFTLEDIADVHSSKMVFLFYGNSGIYIYTVAVLQLIGGLLLIYKNTQLVGALLCLIIFTNAMLVTYAFNFSSGLTIFFALLNLSYLTILIVEYKRLINIFIIHEHTSN